MGRSAGRSLLVHGGSNIIQNQVTYFLQDGKVDVVGAHKLSELEGTASFSIVGGTGRYNDAAGVLELHQQQGCGPFAEGTRVELKLENP
jgi:hypothetical protein